MQVSRSKSWEGDNKMEIGWLSIQGGERWLKAVSNSRIFGRLRRENMEGIKSL